VRNSWSAAAAAAASLAIIAILFWLTLRWSLFVLLLASVVGLLWTWWRRPGRLRRWSVAVCVVAAAVAAAPIDVQLRKTGRASLAVKPIFWGLPTRETMEQIEPDSVVWGGCVVPVNPAHYAVLVSW
jgi:hypothetical protein